MKAVNTRSTILLGLALLVMETFRVAAAAAEPRYELTQIVDSRNLDFVPEEGWDLNDHGDVVGDARFQQFSFGAFLWKNKRLVDLGHTDDVNAAIFARGINNRAEIVGSRLPQRGGVTPVIWRHHRMQDLPLLPEAVSGEAWSINDRGQAVGDSRSFAAISATLWQYGTVEAIAPEGTAFYINNRGQAVGRSLFGTFLWSEGLLTYLFTDRQVFHINNRGEIVGSLALAGGGSAAYVLKDGETTVLPNLPGATDVTPWGSNDHGQVVGESSIPAVARHATLWQDGRVYILQDLIRDSDPRKASTILNVAKRINRKGQILANGQDLNEPGVLKVYLLTPTKRQ